MKNFPDWYFNRSTWQEFTLEEVAEKISGGFGFPIPYQGHKDLKIPFYKVSDMNLPENSTQMSKANNYVSEKIAEKIKAKPFDKDGIIFAKVGEALLLNRKRIAKAPYLIDNNMMVFIPNKKFLDLQYTFQHFLTLRLDHLAQVGAFPSFNMKALANLKIKIPPLEEQKKIGDYFSNFDDAISAQEIKLKSWREVKKSLLQKIFNQDYYFTDDNGQKYPDWQEKTLGEISTKIGSGKTPLGGAKVYQTSGVPFIRSQNIFNDKLNFEDIAYISEKIDESMKNSRVYKNDILLVITGNVGRCCVYKKNIPANVSQHVCIVRLKDDDADFVANQILCDTVQKRIKKIQCGGTREGLNFQQVASLKIKIPCEEEQKKIAEYFTTLDDMIADETKILESLRLMKKDLLKKLFV